MNKNIILFFVSLSVCATVTEGVFSRMETRTAKNHIRSAPEEWLVQPEKAWTQRHESLGWFHVPDKSAHLWIEHTGIDVTLHTNSAGFRGTREYPLNKRAGTTRILGIGDSFTFGWGVQDEETFGAVIESTRPNVEVINIASPGYGIDQMLLGFREIGKQFEPDYVLIGIYPEVFWRATRSYTDAGYGKPYFRLEEGNRLRLQNVPVSGPEELEYNQYPKVISYGLIEGLMMRSAIYRYIKHRTLRLLRDLEWVDPDITEEWRLGKVILRQLISEIREVGAEPVILIIPPYGWMSNTQQTSMQKSVGRLANGMNVDVLDFTEQLQSLSKQSSLERYYIPHDHHWTEEAHALVAQALTNQLELMVK
jgi:hypothetical protein